MQDENSSESNSAKYIFLDEAAKETQDPIQLRSVALDILLAGRDTTASLLGNAFYLLSQRPEIWNKKLRLYSVIRANAHLALRRTTLPTGGGPHGRSPIAISPDDIVSYVPNAMHQRTGMFRPVALIFRPERWESSRASWAYLPFIGGPRICFRQQYALTEAMYTVTRMAQELGRVENKGREWKEKISLSLTNLDVVRVVLTPRTAREK
ncbi:cytochrome P450 [Delitschia confertaspora ATCC 74209]|uniref:Cytochrome P450 n=1 Tax=Delitschia confertaspora ATCC 74209 TaxID=1513339 RepID=A0A9P4JLW5_9PLEO|nr:cytochrome P450 [Delitschia confertaspora ATCC 74209]